MSSKRSIALALSFQKHIIENNQCNRNLTEKASINEIENKLKLLNEGIHNEPGKNINKIVIIKITIGNLLICSAICEK